MNIKKGFLAGVLSYLIMYITNMIYAIVKGTLKIENEKMMSFIIVILFLIIGVSIIGGFISILFLKLKNNIPIKNIYIKSGAFHMLLTILLSFSKILKGQIDILTIITFIFSFLIGILCYFFYIRLTEKEIIAKN